MRISCDLVPGPNIVKQAQLAEELGYSRAFVCDSPALYGDVWVAIAQIAANTQSIGVGTGVLVPHTRHPMVNASAIASIETMAPGRLVVGVGAGNSARRSLGDRSPSKVSWMQSYVETMRGLLRGETVEWEGKELRLLPAGGYYPPFPIEIPIYMHAMGPKSTEAARACADGVMGMPNPAFDVAIPMVGGTVLDDGEALLSPRAARAHSVLPLTVMHNMWEDTPDALDSMPGGAEWRTVMDETCTDGNKHLHAHQEHCVDVGPNDWDLIMNPEWQEMTLGFGSITGTPAETLAKLKEIEAAGATEILYLPGGGDVERELRTFAKAALG